MSKAKLFDLETHFIFVSRDVVFHESVFPYASSSSGSTSSSILPLPCAPPISTLLDDPFLSKPSSSTLPHNSIIQVHHTINYDFLNDMLEEPPKPIADPIPLRRSSRSIKKPSYQPCLFYHAYFFPSFRYFSSSFISCFISASFPFL